MKFFDIIYFSTYKDIVLDKKSTTFGVLFFVSFIYMNLLSALLNLLSILIDYRILKNVSYNLIIYLLIFIVNYLIYEKFNRRESIKIKTIPSILINILFFVSAFLFFYTIYLNNEFFNH